MITIYTGHGRGDGMIIRELTSDVAVIDTPAKINLFLEVLNRRSDGYHNINSVLQAVNLFDRLHVRTERGRHTELVMQGAVGVPSDLSNLVVRAALLMQTRFDRVGGLKIRLTKQIPVAAGLGGGSSDAAATIVAVNLLYGLGLTCPQMAALGAEIGSDVPFFFSGGQALVSGRGESVESISLPTDYAILLVCPDLAVSTAEAYAALKRSLTDKQISFKLRCCRSAQELVCSLRLSGNDFERLQAECHPVLDDIRDRLLAGGAMLARMSGSGPTMFGVFEKAVAANMREEMQQWSRRCFVVKPLRYGLTSLEGGRLGDNGGPGNSEK